MDPLTQTIALLRPQGLLWKQFDGAGDWSIPFAANGGIVFCLVEHGRCVFQSPERETRVLEEGDFLLMSAPPDWSLGVDPIDASRKAKVRLLGGYFRFDNTHASLLTGLLPTIVQISSDDPGAVWLRRVLDLIGHEAASDRPGRAFAMERLLELMLLEVVRHGAAPTGAERHGLLAGLGDPPTAAALKALHADVRRNWTVADLARVAGMSRSVFAERFRLTVGASPIDYLLRWRMALAKDALRLDRKSVKAVGQSAGYQSVSAFSTAFSRTVRCSRAKFAAMAVSDNIS